MAKAQAVALAAARQSGAPTQEQSAQQIQAPVPTTAQTRPQAAIAASPNGVATPVVSTPRPGLNVARPAIPTTVPAVAPVPVKVEAQTTLAQNVLSRPGSAVPRPKSTVPRPGSTKPTIVAGQAAVSTPGVTNGSTPLRSGTPMQVDQQRGTKREREDNVVNGSLVGNGHGPPTIAAGASMMVIDAKAGVPGVRPRPIKKQRMVSAAPFDVTLVSFCFIVGVGVISFLTHRDCAMSLLSSFGCDLRQFCSMNVITDVVRLNPLIHTGHTRPSKRCRSTRATAHAARCIVGFQSIWH